MKKITIEKTKNINKLEFSIPTQNDVYLLVGSNGAGKTTLLVCLERICNPLAFARGFITARNAKEIDQYENALITYQIDNIIVKFRKKTAKWAPSPKEGSKDLKVNFGFSEAVFIRADSKRIDISQDEIHQGIFVSADPEIKATLNQLFETQKYTKLMKLKNANGRGRQAIMFYVIKDGTKYYSEKRFSSGELALLRLVEKIITVSDNSIILLDEAEMALHPRVQKNLHTFLLQKSQEKNLMIIVATHSTSLIKATHRNNIILLKDEPDRIHVITPCYPACAIGSVDFEKNTIFDYIFFVEDDMARLILKKMLAKYMKLEPCHSTAMTSIVPVGGYEQTAELALCTKQQVLSQSQVYAVLDEDAFTVGLKDNPKFKTLYRENPGIVKNLGFTPELWIIQHFEEGADTNKDLIRRSFHCEIADITSNSDYKKCNATNLRKRAKDKVDIVLNYLKRTSGDNESIVLDTLIQILVDNTPDGQIRKTVGPLIGR